jgi:hypothetical protein
MATTFNKVARGITEFLLFGSGLATIGMLIAVMLEVSKSRTYVNTRCMTKLEATVSGRDQTVDDPELEAERRRLGTINNYVVIVLALVIFGILLAVAAAALARRTQGQLASEAGDLRAALAACEARAPPPAA